MIAVFTQADPDDVRRRTLFAADLSFENTYKESGFSRAFTNEIAASTSGTGIDIGVPNMSPADTCLGIWSSVDAEKTFFVPSDLSTAPRYNWLAR